MADQDRDLVLSPVQYAFVQDRTSGQVKVWVGPRADTLTANDRLVVWTGRKFTEPQDLNQARQSFVTATENQYVILTNPAQDGHESFPAEKSAEVATQLDVGKRINLLGPRSFPLWPGQSAEVIEGHRLSLNEYLVVQVYEPEAAKANQKRMVAEAQTTDEGGEVTTPAIKPKDFRLGERLVIQGTSVSFYIPPTGIEVLPDPTKDKREFVREAAVVEQLEHVCFSAGHSVTLAHSNRAKRYIETLLEGEELAGYDESTGEIVPTTVIAKSERVVPEVLRIHFVSGRTVQCTPDHPFHVEKRGGWIDAANLQEGDEVSELKPGIHAHAPAGICQECNGWFPVLHLDHVTPKSERGLNTTDNLRWLCPPCHGAKSGQESSRFHKKRFAEDPELVRTQLSYVGSSGWEKISPDQRAVRRDRRIEGNRKWWATLDPDERAAHLAKANAARLAKPRRVKPARPRLSPREAADARAEGLRKRLAEMTPEERETYRLRLSEGRRRAWSEKTPEERAEHMRPVTEARLAKMAVQNGDPVLCIERICEPTTVYSLQCYPHENYFVRGLLVHNCLVDERGRKRYEKGPQVVFPGPTETFVTERGERKFRHIELNSQSGLYIKVTADYKHDGRKIKAWRGDGMVEVEHGGILKEGDELFLTGADTPIYVPRPEESVITYGDRRKYHAVAIPAGESRYYLDRIDGRVEKVVGPEMFLPDPRTQVVIRRVLDPRTVALWYPGNAQALQVNQALSGEQVKSGGEYLAAPDALVQNVAASGQAGSLSRSYAVTGGLAADRIKRGMEYTPPRTITLDSQYQGAPRVSVWPGYAVLVMDPTGNRRVEVGPVDLLLDYHETLMALTFSTGRPKGSGPPRRDVYLRKVNNSVGDRMVVETRDLVPVSLELSLRVDFEGETPEERQQWFAVEDYVALLTDHVRSKVRNLAKRHTIQTFYGDAIDLIRDALLGPSTEGQRTGLAFPENGMRLYDVEVLAVQIANPNVATLLANAANQAVAGAIAVTAAEDETVRQARIQELERQRLDEEEKTRQARSDAAIQEIERELTRSLRSIAGQMRESEEEAKVSALGRQEAETDAESEVKILRERNDAHLARARTEVELFVQRVNAIDPKLAESIRVFGQERVASEIAQALGPYSLVAGGSAVDILRQRLDGTALAPVLDALADRPMARAAGNGTE